VPPLAPPGVRCAACRAPLAGDEGETCSQCGFDRHVSRLHAVERDPHAPLDTNVACRHCGYNLRGLRPADHCPECATAVGTALTLDLLCLAPPRYATRLAQAATIMTWVGWGVPISFILLLILDSVLPPPFGWVFRPLVAIAFCGLSFAIAISIWLTVRNARPPVARALSADRWALLVQGYAIAWILFPIWLLIRLAITFPLAIEPVLSFMLLCAFALISLGAVPAYFVVLGRVIARLPEADAAWHVKLRKTARNLAIAAPFVIAAMIADAVVNWLAGGPGGTSRSPWAAYFAALQVSATLGFLALAISALQLHHRLAPRLAHQAAQAQIFWNRRSDLQPPESHKRPSDHQPDN
jgi:hypothetical protein